MWCFVVGPSTLFAAEWVLCLESVSPRSAFWKRREVDRSNSAETTGLASRRANEHAFLSSYRYCLNAHPSTPDHPPPVRATMSVAAPEVLDVDFLLYTDQVPDEEDHWRKRILLATAGRDPAVSFDDVIADLHGPPVIRKHYDCTITAPPRTLFPGRRLGRRAHGGALRTFLRRGPAVGRGRGGHRGSRQGRPMWFEPTVESSEAPEEAPTDLTLL